MAKDKNNSGITLLLTLLILAVILAAVAGSATIIIREIKQSRVIESSLIAYYYAESGAENALYRIRGLKVDPEIDDANNLPTNCTLEGECSLSVSKQSLAQKEILYKNQTWQIDLLNPAGNAAGAGAESIKLVCNPESGSLFIKLNILEINTGGSLWQVPEGNKREYMYSCSTSPTTIINNSLTNTNAYIIVVQALYDNALNLEFSAYDVDNAPSPPPDHKIEIASLLEIDLKGRFLNTVQKLKVIMPQRSPLSSLYDWVLFSEEQIIKSL